MSDAAAKKATTAAKQASHAVSNIEEAAQLQAEEVVQQVVEAVPFVSRHKNLLLVGAGVVGTSVVYPLVVKAWIKRKQKKSEKRAEALVEVE